MTVTIPNYQIETKEPSLLQLDTKLYIESMNSRRDRVLVRNTMHGLTIVRDGFKEVEYDGERQKVGKNYAVFFAQGNYFTNQNSKDYDSLTIFYDDGFILDLVKRYAIPTAAPAAKITLIDYDGRSDIEQLISSIAEDHRGSLPLRNDILKLKIELLFLEFYRYTPQQLSQFFAHILGTSANRLRYILEENIDIIENVSDMHRLLQLSPSVFQNQFHQCFHVSPKRWLDTERIKKAEFLLLTTSKTITEIATECGYATASWFIVQFKKYRKTTPKEYRIKNRYQ